MRKLERGIGNMAFISVLVLFVVSTALAFVWNSELEDTKTANSKALMDLRAESETSQKWRNAYDGLKETLGMQDPAIDYSGSDIPNPEAIKTYVRGVIHAKAEECQTNSIVNLKTKVSTVNASKLTVVGQDGENTRVQLYTNPFAKASITVADFLGSFPKPLENAKSVAEVNNQLSEETFAKFTERKTNFDAGLKTAQDGYTQDVQTKSALIDQQAQDLASTRESLESQSAKYDSMSTEVETVKQDSAKKIRAGEIINSALENRLRNEQIKKEIALKENPKDGEVIAVSNQRGTVWINLGKRKRLSRGTKFIVWRAGKGNQRQDIAEIQVISTDSTKAECKITRQISRTRVTRGMNISNPFYDPNKVLRAYIFGNLRAYSTDVARRRLAASGITVTRHLDDTVDVIILGEPAVSMEEVEDEAEAADQARRQSVERSKMLDDVMEKARAINALLVTERALATFIEW